MKWPSLHDYLQVLPLDKVREIHFTRPGWQGDQMVDLHQPVQADDLEILDWVLDRTPDPYVTLEVEDLPEAVVLDQVALMRRFLKGRTS